MGPRIVILIINIKKKSAPGSRLGKFFRLIFR